MGNIKSVTRSEVWDRFIGISMCNMVSRAEVRRQEKDDDLSTNFLCATSLVQFFVLPRRPVIYIVVSFSVCRRVSVFARGTAGVRANGGEVVDS